MQGSVVPKMLVESPDLTWVERFLFHHYISHVAYLMMPYEHPRSPWTSLYPTIALQGTSASAKALYHSLIAHSAFNVARLRNQDQDISTVGFKSYGFAIQNLLPGMDHKMEDFAVAFAAIMTFVMAEVSYQGNDNTFELIMADVFGTSNNMETPYEGCLDSTPTLRHKRPANCGGFYMRLDSKS